MPKVHRKTDASHDNDDSKISTLVGTTNATIELPENSRIVQPSYLEKNTGKVSYKLILNKIWVFTYIVLSDHVLLFSFDFVHHRKTWYDVCVI